MKVKVRTFGRRGIDATRILAELRLEATYRITARWREEAARAAKGLLAYRALHLQDLADRVDKQAMADTQKVGKRGPK